MFQNEKLINFFVRHASKYDKGHEGDPQYLRPEWVSINIPENFYDIEIQEENGDQFDSIPIRNIRTSIEFSDEDGPSSKVINSETQKILKFISGPVKEVVKRIEELKKDFPGLRLAILQNDEPLKDILTKIENEKQVIDWVTKTISDNFKKYCENDDNWKSVQGNDYEF
jgi:hypothetical protein